MNLKSRHCLCAALLLLGGVFVSVGKPQYLETVIGVGANPRDVLWNPTRNKVYVANSESNFVTVIDGASNQVTATVTVADDPTFLCWNPVANKVYCTSNDPDWLSVIDGVGDTLIRKVRMRGDPSRMVYNSTMNKLYVICADDDMVRVYDGSADTLVAEVWFGGNMPGALLWHPVSNRVFIGAHGDIDSVFVIDCATDLVVNRLQAASRKPYAWSWNPLSNLVYVGSAWVVTVLTADGDSVVARLLRNRRQHEERAEVLLSRRANGLEMAEPAESATQLQLGGIPAAAALQSATEAEAMSWLSETYEDVCLKSRMT